MTQIHSYSSNEIRVEITEILDSIGFETFGALREVMGGMQCCYGCIDWQSPYTEEWHRLGGLLYLLGADWKTEN